MVVYIYICICVYVYTHILHVYTYILYTHIFICIYTGAVQQGMDIPVPVRLAVDRVGVDGRDARVVVEEGRHLVEFG